MIFKCKSNNEKWSGEITKIIQYGSHNEIFIKSRSSIMLLYGKTSRGNFACAPDFDASCHLVNLDNIFWNQENLIRVLGKVDGITAASALYKLSKSKYGI